MTLIHRIEEGEMFQGVLCYTNVPSCFALYVVFTPCHFIAFFWVRHSRWCSAQSLCIRYSNGSEREWQLGKCRVGWAKFHN